ncbi:MAG TPA: hypothetical protein VJX74_08475 [Blastocatellia bacterium]|nr:hypothetical protein [Blastocatellia bacterium]
MSGLIKRLNKLRYVRLATITLIASVLFSAPLTFRVTAQEKEKKPDVTQKDDGKVPNEKELEKSRKEAENNKAAPVKLSPVEALVEVAIIAYGGRKQLEAARANIQEQGTIRLATDQGDLAGNYNLRSSRREKSWQDLLRVDLELSPPDTDESSAKPPTVKYVIGFNGASVWSAQNNQYITPRPDADAAFRAQLTHEYMALLRYKEDGSKIELIGPETVVGLDTNVIELTTPDGEKSRFWLSVKSYRILHAEYQMKLGTDQPATKYRISYFYTPPKIAQNTLIPTRRVMTQDGKFVQEIILTTVTTSAKLDPEIFQHLQEQ